MEISHNLIASVRQNLPAMHRYVKLRKKLLGVNELHFYDLYTPIVADQDVQIDYESAKQMAREALMPLGEEYQRMLDEGFQNHWIDVYENQGKRSGAYSAGPYDSHPYVLLNYTDTLNDVFTLVHEMGHALHSYLSNKNRGTAPAGYVIFVAEVASTCNDYVFSCSICWGKRPISAAVHTLSTIFWNISRATLYRQTMFAEFELWCSEQTRKGQPLTAEALSAKYQALNRGSYGDDIVLDPEVALEWARILISITISMFINMQPVMLLPSHSLSVSKRRVNRLYRTIFSLPFQGLLRRSCFASARRGCGYGISCPCK